MAETPRLWDRAVQREQAARINQFHPLALSPLPFPPAKWRLQKIINYLRALAAKVRLTRVWGRPASSQDLLSSHSLTGQVSFRAHPTRDFKCVRIGYKVIPAKPADQAGR